VKVNIGYCRHIDPDKLGDLLQDHSFQFMILESPGELEFAEFNSSTTWSDWQEGVLFGEGAQLRFRRRRGGNYHLVLITPNDLPPGFTLWGQATPVNSVKRYLLWGEWDEDLKAWMEGRLPRKIIYPYKQAKRVVMKVDFVKLDSHQNPVASPDDFDPSPPPLLERFLGLEEMKTRDES